MWIFRYFFLKKKALNIMMGIRKQNWIRSLLNKIHDTNMLTSFILTHSILFDFLFPNVRLVGIALTTFTNQISLATAMNMCTCYRCTSLCDGQTFMHQQRFLCEADIVGKVIQVQILATFSGSQHFVEQWEAILLFLILLDASNCLKTIFLWLHDDRF